MSPISMNYAHFILSSLQSNIAMKVTASTINQWRLQVIMSHRYSHLYFIMCTR